VRVRKSISVRARKNISVRGRKSISVRGRKSSDMIVPVALQKNAVRKETVTQNDEFNGGIIVIYTHLVYSSSS